MKKLLLSSCLMLVLSGLYAQITITSTNMPVSGDTIRVTNVNLTTVTDYTSTGSNYVWNFDSVKATGQSVRMFKSPADAGYPFGINSAAYGEKFLDSLSLPLPGMPVTLKDLMNFYRKNGTASFNIDALGFKYSGFGVPNNYSDKDEMYSFPLDYLDRDSTSFKMSTITTTAMPFSYKKEGYRITESDGWGIISTPYGSTQCLRVVTTQYSIDSIKAMIPIFGFTVPVNIGFPNYQRSIQWLSQDERIPYMEVIGTVTQLGGGETFVPTSARYRDVKRDFVGISEIEDQIASSIYPNPAVNQLNIVIPSNKPYAIEIYNSAGQLVLKKQLDNGNPLNKHSLDVSVLNSGMYLGKLTDGKTAQNFKFSKH